MGRNVAVFRRSRTRYGRKMFIRLWGWDLEMRFARSLPWAHWAKPLHVKRMKTGVKWNLKVGRWFIFAGHVRRAHWSPRQGRKVLECPNCGYTNAAVNYYQRRELGVEEAEQG